MQNLTPQDRDKRLSTPPLQGRGKGWGLSAGKLSELHAHAKHMRNNPTEPEMRLWRHVSNGKLHGHKFRRQQVIGWHIADFVCSAKALIVEVDGITHELEADRKRDAALAEHGYRVIHVTNDEVMRNMDGVLTLISCALAETVERWPTSHPNPSPEGEGLEEAEVHKMQGFSLRRSLEC